MPAKTTPSHRAERLLYIVAVAVTPSIPLFFLYGQNFTEGLLFRHFLIFGAVLAAASLGLYLLISIFLLRRRRTVVLLALFWAVFWFFGGVKSLLARNNSQFSDRRIAICFLFLLIAIAFVLYHTKMSRLVANVTAMVLCALFVFNFAPEAVAAYAGEKQRAENTKTDVLPFEIKRDFYIDPDLPHPNIYWLHMDGMVGFSAVERYFGDPQTELKNELHRRGFVINEDARLEASCTALALPCLLSPLFYDSYLGEKLAAVTHMVRQPRIEYMVATMQQDGFTLANVHSHHEIFKAFKDAGYIGTGSSKSVVRSVDVAMTVNGKNIVLDVQKAREENIAFERIEDFKNLVVDASILSLAKPRINKYIETLKPTEDILPSPNYPETVSKYVTGSSDSDDNMAMVLRAMRYAVTVQEPHIIYFSNTKAHCDHIVGHKISGDAYGEYTGIAFIYDENGNIYKEPLDDPGSPDLYYPQHLYTVKEMMAQIDTILAYDPDAVIVVQSDHGIHGIGSGVGKSGYDSDFMYARGYSLEDQLNLNLQVISAVRIPPQYGELTEPLDPLDITRYLVNHFVGGGNYEYLYYEEGGNQP
ncbi:MAG: energy-coupling factor transporter transmembrane protein EcfT [Lachnospiraceae bacterium]|nr:energy-coupling factor transporter transmembrane protein EcfT [Lachnospiraceae bacterium]